MHQLYLLRHGIAVPHGTPDMLDDDRPLLAVSTDRPDYDVGRKVTVTVRRQPKPGTDLSASEASVEILDPADKTVALAKARGGFGWQHLRAALDSSPLLGAGRVEDTWNLIGRALATPAATVPTPASATSFTWMRASGFAFFKS